LVSCGGSEAPPPKVAEAPVEEESPRERQQIQVNSEVGGLNETKVNRAFEHALGGLRKCINDGARRVEFIAGDIGFQIEVETGTELTLPLLSRIFPENKSRIMRGMGEKMPSIAHILVLGARKPA